MGQRRLLNRGEVRGCANGWLVGLLLENYFRLWLYLLEHFQAFAELLADYVQVVLAHSIRGVLKLVIWCQNNHCIRRILVDGFNEVHSQVASLLRLVLVC